VFEVKAPYRRTINEGGRRRRDKGFGGWSRETRRRRRTNRKRRVILGRRGWGSSEGDRGVDKDGMGYVRRGWTEVGR
jgi:hypothetical protein